MNGLPCSGKTTLAKKLSEHISNLAILDGDEMRELLSPNEDFSRNGIIGHNKKVANIAKLLLDHNVPVCVSKISPFVENREDARKVLANYNFLEVYVKCSIDSCEKRVVRGMY
jgi:adenylylsulfate kinase